MSQQARWFTDEVYTHDASLKAYLRGAFPSVRDIDDVVQESYLRMWRTRASEPIQSAKAFLFTVARRIALDLVRRSRRSPIIPVKEVSELFVLEGDSLAASAVAGEQIQMLAQAIDTLPERCREIFVLCQVEGRTQKEVAARLGVSENTVAVQSARGLHRCEEYIRRCLERL